MSGIKHATALIVVGVDGAEASLTAMRWAVQEAPLHQASVLLIFVFGQYRRAGYAGSPEGPAGVTADADCRALLASAQLEAIRALAPDRVSAELIAGSPAKVLIDRSTGAELLVLGTAYPPGDPATAAPPPMGSVARACIHGAACPVVIVPCQWSCTPARAWHLAWPDVMSAHPRGAVPRGQRLRSDPAHHGDQQPERGHQGSHRNRP